MGRLILEKDIEAKFKARVEKAGAFTYKFASPGRAGVPDRIVLIPGGRIYFVELKRPGGKPRPLQRHVMKKIIKFGFNVRVIDSEEAINEFVSEIIGGTE